MAAVAAVPQFKTSAEPIPSTGIRAKLLANAKEKTQVTPAAQSWRLRRRDENGVKEWEEKHYDVCEIWRIHEFAGEWHDRKDNAITIAKVTVLCPQLEEDHALREDIEKKITESEASFGDPTDDIFSKWASSFTGKGIAPSAISTFSVGTYSIVDARLVDFGNDLRTASFFKTKDEKWRWVDFALSQPAKPKEREALIKTFLKSVSVDAKAKTKDDAPPGGKGLAGYKFESDLPPNQAAQFIKRADTMLSAMQAAYRRYVPPQKEIGVSKVRLFATRAAYDEYMKNADSSESASRSIGLWDPSREELSILYQGKDVAKMAETLKIMRHEGFHQYLFYATGTDHAMWFNEGHACFFENVKFDRNKNLVRIWDDPEDRRPAAVDKDPARYARHVKNILGYDHNKFYSGSLREVNANYVAAWAVVYFLQKGAHTIKDFAPYTQVIPRYLKAKAEGKDWNEATKDAWSVVEGRDFEADFVRFWSKRSAARNFEPIGK